ncbi:NAD+ synthase [bacterium]|nr:NAD+ synthase [candidate division CSSED10-310 bacterium]
MLLGQIVDWLKKVLKETGANGYVFGLSGGVDSAVAGGLIRQAAGMKHFGMILPCCSSPDDLEDALKVAKALDLRTKQIDLTSVYNEFMGILTESTDVQQGNLKARLRMAVLYHYAAELNYLVAGTGNKTEYLIGYFTKFGDGACDVAPIRDLLKRDVRMLAEELEIPAEIIEKPPSAGLWEGQTDEAEIGLTYEILDSAVIGLEQGSTIVPFDAMEKVIRMHQNSRHKRQLPLSFKRPPRG